MCVLVLACCRGLQGELTAVCKDNYCCIRTTPPAGNSRPRRTLAGCSGSIGKDDLCHIARCADGLTSLTQAAPLQPSRLGEQLVDG